MGKTFDERIQDLWQQQLKQRERDFADEAIREARARHSSQRPLYEIIARHERDTDRWAREWRERTIARNGLDALMGGTK